jgi:hypothetical protein
MPVLDFLETKNSSTLFKLGIRCIRDHSAWKYYKVDTRCVNTLSYLKFFPVDKLEGFFLAHKARKYSGFAWSQNLHYDYLDNACTINELSWGECCGKRSPVLAWYVARDCAYTGC